MATEVEPTVGEALAGLVVYTVQVHEEAVLCSALKETPEAEAVFVWRDLTTVAVPPRTKRKTVVEKALEQARGARPDADGQPLHVRVLGPEDARAFKVSAVVRDPELRIEGV